MAAPAVAMDHRGKPRAAKRVSILHGSSSESEGKETGPGLRIKPSKKIRGGRGRQRQPPPPPALVAAEALPEEIEVRPPSNPVLFLPSLVLL